MRSRSNRRKRRRPQTAWYVVCTDSHNAFSVFLAGLYTIFYFEIFEGSLTTLRLHAKAKWSFFFKNIFTKCSSLTEVLICTVIWKICHSLHRKKHFHKISFSNFSAKNCNIYIYKKIKKNKTFDAEAINIRETDKGINQSTKESIKFSGSFQWRLETDLQ